MKLITALIAVSLAGTASGNLEAQPLAATSATQVEGGAPALRQALRAAWERAVAARESNANRNRAAAEQDAAGRLWARPPSVEISHRDDRWQTSAGRRESELGVSVPIWLPGQRAVTRINADSQVEEAHAAERFALLRLAGEIRELAWTAIGLASSRSQAQRQLALLERLAEDVDRRVTAGDLARIDSLVAGAEVLAVRGRLAEADHLLLLAQSRWTQMTGLELLPSPDGLREATLPERTDVTLHPEMQWLTQRSIRARTQLDLVRQSNRDAPEVRIGMRHDVSDGPAPSQNSLLMGIRVPLGTSDRNRPLLASASGDLDVAQTAELRGRERIASDLRDARRGLSAAEQQHAASARRAELLRERAALLDKAFRAGEGALPDLLRALALASEADQAAAQQEAMRGLARARLQQASGALP